MAFHIRHCAWRCKKRCRKGWHSCCIVEESGFLPVHGWRIRNAALGQAGCAISRMRNSSGRDCTNGDRLSMSFGGFFRQHRRDGESNQQAITRRLLVFLEIDLAICPGNQRLNHARSLAEGPAIEALLVDMPHVDQGERSAYLAIMVSARSQSDFLVGFQRNNSSL